MQILPEDDCSELGAMLLRMVAPEDVCSQSYLGSVLRALDAERSIARGMPNYRTNMRGLEAEVCVGGGWGGGLRWMWNPAQKMSRPRRVCPVMMVFWLAAACADHASRPMR
eukprot:206076-Chlamydomonas_euryale.AAC.1